MEKSKLTLLAASVPLIVSIQASAFELELSSFGEPVISEQGCAYGRGKLSVETAKAQAADNLRSVLQSTHLLSSAKQFEEVDDAVFAERNIEALATGLSNGTVALTFSSPELLGDDTCVTASLPLSPSESDDDIAWDDDNSGNAIIVSGEGKHDAYSGLSARQIAEQDALRRAISQVIGVVIKSGLSTLSTTDMVITESSETLKSAEMVRQSLSMTSHGKIKKWSEISSVQLADGSFKVTLNVEVEQSSLIDQLRQTMRQIGNPNVFIVTKHDNVRYHLAAALVDMGMTPTSSPESASLLLVADARTAPSNVGTRLQLDISLQDRVGNRYGQWRNDPSFIALPHNEDVLSSLAEIYLQARSFQADIKKSIERASHALVHAGGPVREISIHNDLSGNHAELYALLSSLADVNDVKIVKGRQLTRVQLRSINTMGELAHLLSPAMKVHANGKSINVNIVNDYQLSIL